MSSHTRVTPDQQVFRLLCEKINSPMSLKAWILFSAGQFSELVNLKLDPLDYVDASAFADDYCIINFLSKSKGLVTGIDTKAAALSAWSGFESMCLDTNRRLKDFVQDPNRYPGVASVISVAQRKIQSVLGPRPKLSEVLKDVRWSNGATFANKRGTPFTKKMTRRLDVTRRCLPYLVREVSTDPLWCESLIGIRPEGPVSLLDDCFKIVEGNRCVVVPKNAKTGRMIAAEPTGNAFIQQAVGRYLKSRLKRFGVDLTDQSRNRALAAEAFDRNLATLDLRGASDTLAIDLVYLLLPLDWAILLDDLRSPCSKLSGRWHRLSKFSSMGNAFTFELESLIFWAIASACAEEMRLDGTPVGIFGDDIIVDASVVPTLERMIEFCGFSVNTEKSFSSGCFYESCGGHYYEGRNVTPIYQKERTDEESSHDDLPEDVQLIRLHNRVHRWTMRMHPSASWNGFRRKLLEVCRFSKGISPAIPWSATSDDGFLVDPRLLGPCDRNHGYYVRVLRFKARPLKIWNLPALAYKLRRPGYTSSNPRGLQESSFGGRWAYSFAYVQPWE